MNPWFSVGFNVTGIVFSSVLCVLFFGTGNYWMGGLQVLCAIVYAYSAYSDWKRAPSPPR